MADDIRMQKTDTTFSVRTAGLLCRDGMLFVQHERGGKIYALPGGTVQLGEATDTALLRELREEVGITADIVRLLWIEESFWQHRGQTQHSIVFYYLIDTAGSTSLPDFASTIPQRDNGDVLLGWLPLDALNAAEIYPAFLAQEITRLDGPIRHFVTRE